MKSFIFTTETIGLPDSAFKKPDGQLDETMVRHKLRITRTQNRFLSKRLKPVLAEYRSMHMIPNEKFGLLIEQGMPKVRNKIVGHSLRTIQREIIGTVFDDSATVRKHSFNVELENWDLMTLFEWDRGAWVRACELKNNVPETEARGEAFEEIPEWARYACKLIYEKASDEMENWVDLPQEEQGKLSEVFFALGYILGMDSLNETCFRYPCLFDYYTTITGLKFNQELSKIELLTAKDSESHSRDEPELCTIEEWHEAIETKLEQAKADSRNQDILENIQSLVSGAIEWVSREEVAFGIEEDLLPPLCRNLLEQGTKGGLADDLSNDRSIFAFKAAWRRYITSTEARKVSEESITHTIVNARKTFDRVQVPLNDARDQHDANRKLVDALKKKSANTRAVRRELDNELSDIEQKQQAVKNAIYEYEDELLNAILPPGTDIDSWEDTEDPGLLDRSDVPEAMYNALVRAHEFLLSWDDEQSALSSAEVREETEFTSFEDFSPAFPNAETEALERDDGGNESARAESIADENLPEALPEVAPELETAEPIFEAEAESSPELERESEAAVDEESIDSSEVAGPGGEQHNTEVGEGPVDEAPVVFEGKAGLQVEGMAQLNESGAIEGEVINEALSKHMLNGRLEYAALLASTVEQSGFTSDAIGSALIEAAFFGQNVWGIDRSLSKAQNYLCTISTTTIEDAVATQGGKSVLFLVFTAAFQSALFGGNQTNAGTLLQSIEHAFDGPIKQLIQIAADIAKHDKALTIANLVDQKEGDLEAFDHLMQEVNSWERIILDSKKGYAPIRKAQTYLVEQGEISDILGALRQRSTDDIASVRKFVTKYSNRDACEQLLEEAMKHASSDLHRVELFSSARGQFVHKIDILIEFCHRWLSLQQKSTTQIQKICQKLGTMLKNGIESLRRVADDDRTTLEWRAGVRVAMHMLENLRRVSEGSKIPIWKADRAEVWFNHPSQIVRLLRLRDDTAAIIEWLLAQAGRPPFYDEILELAMEKAEVSLASLMLLALRDRGDDRKRLDEEIEDQFVRLKVSLKEKCTDAKNKVESANLGGHLSSERAAVLLAELDNIDDYVADLKRFEPAYDIDTQMMRIDDEVERETSTWLQKARQDYRDALEQMAQKLPNSPVPPEWKETFEDAFEKKNLLVVDEMLYELQTSATQGQPIREDDTLILPLLDEFLACESIIYEALHEAGNAKEVWHQVNGKEPAFGLNFSNKYPELRRVVEIFHAWSTRKRPNDIDDQLYLAVKEILTLAGFKVEKNFSKSLKSSLDFNKTDGFCSFTMKTDLVKPGTPFNIFGPRVGRPVILAYKDWDFGDVIDYMRHTKLTATTPILISVKPISGRRRQEFANQCKRDESTILLVDPVMAIFLGAQPRDSAGRSAIANYLWTAVPWTYFNPYIKGDVRMPPPIEMRFGREREITRLLEMNNGAAIVFGGRQLGKSTILQQVLERFHAPTRNQFAFYEISDKDMDRTEITREKWNYHQRTAWKGILDKLASAGIAKQPKQPKQPKEPSVEYIQKAVEDGLRNHPEQKVIMIFDEIDPILNLDSAHDFGLFRGFRELVSKPGIQGRFKIIIAGLENVKRFESSTNNPLQQLGSTLPISIMSTRDAQKLLIQPMAAAGYEFADAKVINQVLIETNRHPGLLQIFCHELLATVGKNPRGDIGRQRITSEDVRNVASNRNVMELVRNRFDMTLNLDHRYLVIIYGLLSEGKGVRPFTPREAKGIAVTWMPNEFEKLTTAQFEAYLDELVGLGVLKEVPGDKQSQYQLRNNNIRRMIGSDDEMIYNKLNEALEQHTKSSPLDRHAYLEAANLLSPITFRDEKGLFGIQKTNETQGSQIHIVESRNYTVSIIVGSSALGMDKVGDSIRELYQAELQENPKFKNAACYELHQRKDTSFDTPEQFETRLNNVITKQAKIKPYAVVVDVTGEKSIAHVIGLIDAANRMNGKNEDSRYPVRVAFCLLPKAYWQWLNHPTLTLGREDAQHMINLAPWATSAISHLLEKLGLNNSTEDVRCVMDHTLGWYLSLEIMACIKLQKYPNAQTIADLGKGFRSMRELKPGDASKLLKKVGIDDVDWARPFLRELCDNVLDGQYNSERSFEAGYIDIVVEDTDIFGEDTPSAKAVAHWLSSMSILRRVRSEDPQEPVFHFDPAVAHSLALEYAES